MRKLLSTLSSTLLGGARRELLLLALFASVSAIYASNTNVGGIWYDFDSSTKTASVTYRGNYSSHYNEYYDEVIIPENVTYNGITYSVTSIGDDAFSTCSYLTSVTIPNSVTSIGDDAFSKCSSLTSVTIPNSVTSIGSSVFRNCSSLTSVTIPNSVTSIGSSAFEGCSSLTSVTIPNSVTSIGEGAFRGCSSLTSPVYNAHCFAYMPTSYIGAYIIPQGIKQIAGYAFSGCSSLTSVTIPNSVTSIGYVAFYSCSSLTSVTIPDSVTYIGDGAFNSCYALKTVTINSDAIVNKTNTFSSNLSQIFGSQVTDYIIGDGVWGIGDYAFSGCSSLTSVTIPNSVTSIGDGAFQSCSSLTSVAIPNSVTSIGDYAFCECSSLTSVTIPNSVTSIGNKAFCECSSLTSVTIGNNLTSIGAQAFVNCSVLKAVYITDVAAWCGIAFKDYDSNPLYYAKKLYLNGDLVTDLVIPSSVTSIGNTAFYGCSYLTSITCEAETPPTIGDWAFDLVPTSIPVYVPCGRVGVYRAASGWNSFTNIQEPVAEYSINVTTSGEGEVDVYNSICGNSISAHPSQGYHFVQWSDGNTDNPRTLELTKDTILTAEFAQSYSGKCGDNLYWLYNENEQSITITGTGYMYDYYTPGTQPWTLFMGNIKKVTTDNTAKSFGAFAFDGAIRLAEVHIGTSIETIDIYAFGQCDRLRNIYCYPTYPPIISDYSFVRYDANLYLPCDYIEDYMFDYYWKKFENVQCAGAEKEEMGSNGVEVAPSSTSVTITWPTEGNADTYTIVIKKGNEVFCTLTFNADGQLLNIAFAPGRDGNHPIQYAEQAGNGYRFTVTSLESGTKYGYNIDVKDAANKTIKSHSGEFTTQSTTAVDNITTNNANIQKIMRDGQFIIVRDGVEYNAVGQEIGN